MRFLQRFAEDNFADHFRSADGKRSQNHVPLATRCSAEDATSTSSFLDACFDRIYLNNMCLQTHVAYVVAPIVVGRLSLQPALLCIREMSGDAQVGITEAIPLKQVRLQKLAHTHTLQPSTRNQLSPQ